MLNKKQATDLAKAWRLGNKFRKKSLAKKHNIAPATSKNTGRVKMGIRMDIESKPQEYYPALDDDGTLIFFSGSPMKRIPLSDLFTPPKATKGKRPRIPAKENTMINHHLEILKTSFPNEVESVLEAFLEKSPFDIKEFSLYQTRLRFESFKESLVERTEYQLVAQKITGEEVKSNWYKDENDLAELQQKCEDNDSYESTSVLKRIVDVDEEEEDDVDYTDGTEQESKQVDESDVEILKLTTLALKQIPGSPKQRETIKKLNILRKKAGLNPLKEKEIDINDEISESLEEAKKVIASVELWNGKKMKKSFPNQSSAERFIKKMQDQEDVRGYNMYAEGLEEASEKQLLIKDLKMLIKNPDARMVKMYGGGNKYVDMLKKKLTKLESMEEASAAQLAKLSKQDILDLLKVFKGVTRAKKTITMLSRELDSRNKKESVDESTELEESKALDKLKFKGSDKKNAEATVSIIKRGDSPKDIARMFKKLKTPSQEAIMTALGDKSSKDYLQKGQLLKALISIFDEVDPKGLDGRSKAFREKVRKLEYNKKKDSTFEVWGESTELDEAMKFWKVTITKKAGKLFKGQNVVTKARNSAEAIKKGIKQMKGNPALVPGGSVTAELDEGAKKVVKEKKLGALQKKSDKTGIPYGILKQVFNRGVAAWRTGHRPGTNPTQWGYARVNSFATKSKGTWGGADKDLAAKVRG